MDDGHLDINHFQELLELERDRYDRRVKFIDATGLTGSLGENTAELSVYDNHPADLGSETFERQKDLGLKLDAGFFIGEIDDALERIEGGTYGQCLKCGATIGTGRLEAVAWTRYCLECQAEEEKRPDGRPVEEMALWPPFGRIDGEDIWESLEAYGTSNAPQDHSPAEGMDDETV